MWCGDAAAQMVASCPGAAWHFRALKHPWCRVTVRSLVVVAQANNELAARNTLARNRGAPGPGQLRPGRRLRRRSHEVGADPDRAGPRGLLDRRRQAPVQAPHGPDLDFARRQRFVPGNRHLNQKTRDDGTLIRDTTGAARGGEATTRARPRRCGSAPAGTRARTGRRGTT